MSGQLGQSAAGVAVGPEAGGGHQRSVVMHSKGYY
jgi:hypothetical protein